MSLNISLKEWSGLTCRVIDALPPGETPKCLVVLCHGYGAPGDDLAAFGPYLLEEDDDIAAGCRFVFPEAPIDLTPHGLPGGRAWWPINMAQLAVINQTRDYNSLTSLTPPGMNEATTQLVTAVREMQSEFGLTDSRTVLGGFSQGAMICTNALLTQEVNPALLVLFSGTLLSQDEWTAAAAEHPGCRVVQSHGRQDEILPYEPAESLRDLLSDSGFSVNFVPFHGGHAIPADSVIPVVIREIAQAI